MSALINLSARWPLAACLVLFALQTSFAAEKLEKPAAVLASAALTGQQPLEDSFKTIHKMDENECIPRLLCELAASARKAPLSAEEATILTIFSNEKTVVDKSGKSILTTYKLATDIGALGTDESRCQKNFNKCPLEGPVLMKTFKDIIVKH